MKKWLTLLILGFSIILEPINAQFGSSYESLRNDFNNPPLNARPKVYWWWLNGNTDNERIKEEIAAMKNAGISGFDIFEIGVPASNTMIKPGPAFLSDESLQAIKLAIDEAGKYGMEVGLNMASSWNAGGSWISPEHSAKSIYCSIFRITPNMPRNIKLPFPEIRKSGGAKPDIKINYSTGKPEWYREIAVIAVPAGYVKNKIDTADILDVTRFFNIEQEFLQWSVPSGEWDIYRFICSNSGEQLKLPSAHSAGPIIDHFDSIATETHFMHVIDRIKSTVGDIEKCALKSLYLASYEVTGNVWTPSLPDEFMKLNGYSLIKFLPSFFNHDFYDPEKLENFRKDLRKTLSALMINNFYRKASEVSHRFGLKINSESGGPGLPLHNVPVEPLKSLGTLDIPRGEFWVNHTYFNSEGIDILRVVKEVAAASHIYERGIVEEESFSSFQHWQEGPFDIKPYGDRAFCEGMNRVVIHGFSHNPNGTGYPGIAYHAGTHFNDKRVWWAKIKPFTDYLSRISAILQGSDFFADVLYFYGDDIPNYTGPKNSRFSAGPGYDYEVINAEMLKRLDVKNGKLILPSGAQFSVMAYDENMDTDPELMKKMNELVQEGAIITGSSVARSLISLGIPPDLDYNDKDLSTIDYIHYVRGETDLYFLRNTTDNWISRNCDFRQQKRIPEYWNPVTGEIIPVWIYEQNSRHITIPITLAPYGTCIIVFRKGQEPVHFTGIAMEGKNPPPLQFIKDGVLILEDGKYSLKVSKGTIEINYNTKTQFLNGAWELSFPSGWGAPEKVILPELISWTESGDPGIKYFSGNVTYEKTFQYDPYLNFDKDYRIFIDLGTVSKVGEAWLNDVNLGIAWCEPNRFDVTDILKAGNNTLKIEVANTWSNRLTGDAVTGGKYTKTNITATNIKGLNNVQVPWAKVPLIKSGLIGPVKLVLLKPVRHILH